MGLFSTKSESTDTVFQATREIAAAFERHELKHSVNTVNGNSILDAGFSGKNISSFRMLFISSDNDNDVAVRVFNIVPSVPEEKKSAMLKAINHCNNQFRYVKFTMQDDSSVSAQYDLPLRSDNVGEAAVEIAVRLLKIIDDSYPEFMKALWS